MFPFKEGKESFVFSIGGKGTGIISFVTFEFRSAGFILSWNYTVPV